jgi:carboxyl-terminal processing protease
MFQFSKKKIAYGAVLLILVAGAFGAGFFTGKATVICPVCKPETLDFSLFWDAYNKLHENFISPEKITDQAVTYGAIDGMAKSLGDPYTSFFDPEQAKLFEQDLAGSFSGIGIEVGIKKGFLTVIAPLKNTPSEAAGLKPGDQIVKINGKNTGDMSTDEAVGMIRGKNGTQVTLTIAREGWKDTQDFTITRGTINIPSVDWEMKDGDVAYIHIYQFDQTLSANFKKAALEILNSNAKKIVLDLRGNPGGYLETCQDIAGWFLPQGQVVTIEDFGQGKESQQYKAQGNAAFASWPVVVLMDGGSASASEILAGALHDNRGIQLVGAKSFGKGSVQEVVKLNDGQSFLKITIARWLTPKGNSISEVGLAPDVAVPSGDQQTAGQDPQLDKALEIIRNLP